MMSSQYEFLEPEERKLLEEVDRFALQMKKKLLHKLRVDDFWGWDDLENWGIREIKKRLEEHVEKAKVGSDFIDIANLAMFAAYHYRQGDTSLCEG